MTTITTTTMITSTVSPLDAEIQAACKYLSSNYNTSLGLISENTSHTRYYLYSDNFLAVLVLQNDCGNPSLAQSINATLNSYDTQKIPNQYMVFACKGPYVDGSKDYELSGKIWTTVNNQTGPPLNDSYADIAFLQVYYSLECSHDRLFAQSLFSATSQMYNGTGFTDLPYRFPNSSSYHQFQTYKLALFIYTATLFNSTAPISAFANMIEMQATNGGFYTGYLPNLSNDGTTTNTETTCLAIMALKALSE